MKLIKIYISFLLMMLGFATSYAQDNRAFDALANDFPELMKKFGEELKNEHADYVFAIDVSGTMNKYEKIVVPALKSFFRSVQDGDYVSVIKFGGEAKNEPNGFGIVNSAMRQSLVNYADRVYDKPASAEERKKFTAYTDLLNMLEYLEKDLTRTGRNNLKFVFLITDFLNDPVAGHSKKLHLDDYRSRIEKELAGKNIKLVALELPKMGSGETSTDDIMNAFSMFKPQTIPVSNEQALQSWFDQMKNDIALEKFKQFLIGKMTQEAGATINSVDVDIDGHMSMTMSWVPNDVFDAITLDSLSITDRRMHLVMADEDECEDHPELKLPHLMSSDGSEESFVNIAQIRGDDEAFFNPHFEKPNGRLKAHISFKVPYEAELIKLMGKDNQTIEASIELPQENVFCHPMAFKWYCIMWILIIIYILSVILCIKRNCSDKYKLRGEYTLTQGTKKICTEEINGRVSNLTIDVEKAECNVVFKQKKYISKLFIPILHWSVEPKYEVTVTNSQEYSLNGGDDYTSGGSSTIKYSTTIPLQIRDPRGGKDINLDIDGNV